MTRRSHPFVIKLYPLTDGEVHALVEDIIDTQKHVNRMISLLDQVMRSSAKGVLLFPETALPDGWTWEDARRCWSSANGLLPYNPRIVDAKPEQISSNGTNAGAYHGIRYLGNNKVCMAVLALFNLYLPSDLDLANTGLVDG